MGIILGYWVGDLPRSAYRGTALPLDTPKRYLAAFLGHFVCPWSSARDLGVERLSSA